MQDELPIVHGEPVIFKIGEHQFKAVSLPLEKSFEGLDILQRAVSPLLAEASTIWGEVPELDAEGNQVLDAGGKPSTTFGRLPGVTPEMQKDFIRKCFAVAGVLSKLSTLFGQSCEVLVPGVGYIECNKSTTIFARRTGLAIAWLIECLRIQYADFLDGTGLQYIAVAVRPFISLLGFDRKSG